MPKIWKSFSNLFHFININTHAQAQVTEEATAPVQQLPEEIQRYIFFLLSRSTSGFNKVNFSQIAETCKQWLRITKDLNPLEMLKKGHFNADILKGPLCQYAKDWKDYERITSLIGPDWITKQIINCGKDDDEHADFILQNLFFTKFDPKTPCQNEKVQSWLNVCKKAYIMAYDPVKHLDVVLPFDHTLDSRTHRDPVFTSRPTIKLHEVHSSIWREALRMGILQFHEIPCSVQDPEICLVGVQVDEDAFNRINKKFITHQICLIAVQKQVTNYLCLPQDEKQTPDIRLVVQKQKPALLQFDANNNR